MQRNNGTMREYLSRKYIQTLIAELAIIFVIIFVDKAQHYEWGAVLVAIIAQYAWFNTKEANVIKDLEVKKLDLNSSSRQSPVEPSFQ